MFVQWPVVSVMAYTGVSLQYSSYRTNAPLDIARGKTLAPGLRVCLATRSHEEAAASRDIAAQKTRDRKFSGTRAIGVL